MKKQPYLTIEEREKIHKDYFFKQPGDIDFQIDLAFDHNAAKKAGNSGSWNLYIRNWLHKWSGFNKSQLDRLNPRTFVQ